MKRSISKYLYYLNIYSFNQIMSSNAYPYSQNIRSPSQLGMSPGATAKDLTNDISGLQSYISLLSNGTNTPASATGGPLGNKFFLKTEGTCSANGTNVDRYIYVNNVPNGDIPFIGNISGAQGLIPGIMSDLGELDPAGLFSAFTSGSTPPCQEITMQTIDNQNNSSVESHYVTVTDISAMSPCSFPNGVNPVTNGTCSGFQNYSQPVAKNSAPAVQMSNDPIDKMYFTCIIILGIYIFYCLMQKSN